MNQGKDEQPDGESVSSVRWRDLEQGSHIVEYYNKDAALMQSLARNLIESLEAGETCIVVATKTHHRVLGKLTKERGINLAAMRRGGSYRPLDANALLKEFMVGDHPDWEKFEAVVGPVISAAAKGGAPIRAYGEMVALLWQRGRHEAAIELERLWNRLAARESFVLHCAYPIEGAAQDRRGMNAIIKEHTFTFAPAGSHDLPTHFRQMQRSHKGQTSLGREIARRERAEAALRASEASRQQLQELSAVKDEYLSIASHQLRTPATIVKQYLSMLLEGYDGDLTPGQREKIRLAFESNERQLKIINDLLMLASVESGTLRLNRERHDIGQIIQDVAAEQTPELARRSQTLELILQPAPLLSLDGRYIRMVLENLINNASKYSPHGTPITMTVAPDGETVRIAVADKGIGISKADQARLFKKFSRIDGAYTHGVEGTGLGLYWVKKIVELHGGELSLASRVKRGSTFTVTLPLPSPLDF